MIITGPLLNQDGVIIVVLVAVTAAVLLVAVIVFLPLRVQRGMRVMNS